MLASLLPGLRDVRTPIMVGYSWLLTGWLIFANKLPKHRPPGNGPIAQLFDLSHLVGPAATVATLSVVAYILGAILTIPTENRRVSSALSILSSADRSTWNEFAIYTKAASDNRRYRTLVIAFVADLKARLLAASQEMYGEYDRLAAEASFRINLVLPLWAITGVLIKDLNVNWQVYERWFHRNRNAPVSNQALLHNILASGAIWGVVLLVASIILLVQGANRLAMSRNVLMRAVMTETIGIPEILKAKMHPHARQQGRVIRSDI